MCCLSPMTLQYSDRTECIKCGTVKYLTTPYKVRSVEGKKTSEGIKEIKSYNHNHRGICRNCQREMAMHCDNLCGSCYNQTRGIPKGPEREARLLRYRQKQWPHKFRKAA